MSCLQYLSRANDVEMMLREKHRQVSSDDYGRDEDAADKLLTKHKVRNSRLILYTINNVHLACSQSMCHVIVVNYLLSISFINYRHSAVNC